MNMMGLKCSRAESRAAEAGLRPAMGWMCAAALLGCICAGVARGSDHLYPEPWLQAVSLNRSINKNGFHRELVIEVKLGEGACRTCCIMIKEEFPRGLYVDPYELALLREHSHAKMEMLRRSSVFAAEVMEVFDRSPPDKELISQAKALCRDYIHSRLIRAGIVWSKPDPLAAGPASKLTEVSAALLHLGDELEYIRPNVYRNIAKQLNISVTAESIVSDAFLAVAAELFSAAPLTERIVKKQSAPLYWGHNRDCRCWNLEPQTICQRISGRKEMVSVLDWNLSSCSLEPLTLLFLPLMLLDLLSSSLLTGENYRTIAVVK
ncbi:bcl-2-related ovarian killer protein homolog A isoform X2 [Narcine bancroftii]|uniref:bcl-2-related ovarian killer protein homolog A isoform X2 n=1 Tax=Narcine bancroftii TaxID=1343680 RepID=UPI0038318FFE